ncbi:MAG: CPBP family intramembrane glutamic endopeptidase [Promethearchaeota archaeon]
MEIHLINLLYYVYATPIVVIFCYALSFLNSNKKNNKIKIVIILCFFLFLIRYGLVIFGETVGIMPYLVEDVLFYSLLTIFGLILTWFYAFKIEKVSLEEIGWKIEDIKKSILFGLLGFIPLILMFPLILFLAEIKLAVNITYGKIIVALGFTILGAFYEEIMFRGIIQNHINDLIKGNSRKTIVYTAALFTITHLFYLPFTGFGIYYIFVFIMALILSSLRIKYDQLACAILHGGIVFILIIVV